MLNIIIYTQTPMWEKDMDSHIQKRKPTNDNKITACLAKTPYCIFPFFPNLLYYILIRIL